MKEINRLLLILQCNQDRKKDEGFILFIITNNNLIKS